MEIAILAILIYLLVGLTSKPTHVQHIDPPAYNKEMAAYMAAWLELYKDGGHYHKMGYGTAVYIPIPVGMCQECRQKNKARYDDVHRYDVLGPDFGGE